MMENHALVVYRLYALSLWRHTDPRVFHAECGKHAKKHQDILTKAVLLLHTGRKTKGSVTYLDPLVYAANPGV